MSTPPLRRLYTPQDIARAAKALNYVYGLTPAARRVGLALLDHLNVYNGRCDPSEYRLAAMLNLSERTIRKAKAELNRAGFLTWTSHGGLPLTADYRLNFVFLHATCEQIEKDAKMLLPKRHRGSYRQFCSGVTIPAQTGTSVLQSGMSVPPNYSNEPIQYGYEGEDSTTASNENSASTSALPSLARHNRASAK